MSNFDPYKLLGVPRDADPSAIKTAYRDNAKRCHPDRAGATPATARRFHQLSHAYAVLSDPLRRRFYDRHGEDPHELGIEGPLLAQAVRPKRVDPTKRVARSECPICEGTGWRPGGRACDQCDPNLAKTALGEMDAWDPTVSDGGGRVRLSRRSTKGNATRKPKSQADKVREALAAQRARMAEAERSRARSTSEAPDRADRFPAGGSDRSEAPAPPEGRLRLKKP